MRVLVSGGGTGGHIYPALAILDEIKKQTRNSEFLYVGTKAGLESELVPKEGYDFVSIRVKAMPRKINFESVKAIKELVLGLSDANKIIKDFKPDIVIGTGGFVSGPILYMASRKKNIFTLIHEQNAYPGITNKILSRYVDRIAITFDESKKYFLKQEKVTLTGNPIRSSILNVNKDEAYKELNIDKNLPFILSFGGSGGQKQLNEGMLSVIEKNINNKGIQIFHVTGKRLYEDFMKFIEKKNIILGDNIKIFPYFYDMPKALNIADLVIASAGAITLAEISAVGIPSILIPKSYTAENHQEYNARLFSDNKASEVILEKDLSGDLLNNAIMDIIYNRGKLIEMRNNSKKLGNINASKEIVKLLPLR